MQDRKDLFLLGSGSIVLNCGEIVPPDDLYSRLIALLDQHGAHYRLIDHPPEGRTELVSAIRGNALSQAAKCIIIAKVGRKERHYVLAVVLGDAQVDLGSLKKLFEGTYVAFCIPRGRGKAGRMRCGDNSSLGLSPRS